MANGTREAEGAMRKPQPSEEDYWARLETWATEKAQKAKTSKTMKKYNRMAEGARMMQRPDMGTSSEDYDT